MRATIGVVTLSPWLYVAPQGRMPYNLQTCARLFFALCQLALWRRPPDPDYPRGILHCQTWLLRCGIDSALG